MAQTEKLFDFSFYNSKNNKKNIKDKIVFWTGMIVATVSLYALEVKLHEKPYEVPVKSESMLINEEITSVKNNLYSILENHGEFMGRKITKDEISVKIEPKDEYGAVACKINFADITATVWSKSPSEACRESMYHATGFIHQKEQQYIKEYKPKQKSLKQSEKID